MRKWLLLISLPILIVLTGCTGHTWYGEGKVIGKTSMSGVVTCGKNEVCTPVGRDCYYLKVLDKYDVEHEGCVSEMVWTEATMGSQITISPQHH